MYSHRASTWSPDIVAVFNLNQDPKSDVGPRGTDGGIAGTGFLPYVKSTTGSSNTRRIANSVPNVALVTVPRRISKVQSI
jgi:hypothetical protein